MIELIKEIKVEVDRISTLSIAISNNGNWIAIAGSKIELYDQNWQQSIEKVKIEDEITTQYYQPYGICFTCSNSHLVFLNRERYISCWDIERSSIISKKYDRHEIFSYSFPHPDNQTFFVVDRFSTVRQFSVSNHLLAEEWSKSYHDLSIEDPQKMAISSDRKLLYGTHHIISSEVMNNSAGKKIEISLPDSYPQVFSMDLSPDESILVTGSDQRIRISDARSAQTIHSFYAHADSVVGVAVTADSRFIISAGDLTLKIWDLATGRKLNTIIADRMHRMISTAFNRNTGQIVTGHVDGTVRVWQLS